MDELRMMGVYIRGMEMPSIDLEWRIIRGQDGKWYAIDDNAETSDGEWHEIVPVPPHGRLIDAGRIYDAVERRYRISSGIEHRCERDLLDLICAAPTIIPAEEDE